MEPVARSPRARYRCRHLRSHPAAPPARRLANDIDYLSESDTTANCSAWPLLTLAPPQNVAPGRRADTPPFTVLERHSSSHVTGLSGAVLATAGERPGAPDDVTRCTSLDPSPLPVCPPVTLFQLAWLRRAGRASARARALKAAADLRDGCQPSPQHSRVTERCRCALR